MKILREQNGVRLVRRDLTNPGGGLVSVSFVVYGPGPGERVFGSEDQAQTAFDAAVAAVRN